MPPVRRKNLRDLKPVKSKRVNGDVKTKSNSTSKHVAMERRPALRSETKHISQNIESEQESDFEIDIEPNRKRHSNEDISIETRTAKRTKSNDKLSDSQLNDNASEMVASISPQQLNELQEVEILDKDLNVEDDEIQQNKDNDASNSLINNQTTEEHSSKQTNLDIEIASEIEIEIDSHIQSENENEIATEANDVVETEANVDIEASHEVEADADAVQKEEEEIVIELEVNTAECAIGNEIATVAEPETEKQVEVDGNDDMENVDDDILSLLDENDDDLFAEEDDILKSPLIQPKKTTTMSIPNWKKAEMEKEKKAEPKKLNENTIENRTQMEKTVSEKITSAAPPTTMALLTKTAGITTIRTKIGPPAATASVTAPHQPNDRVVYKIPRKLLDPRLRRGDNAHQSNAEILQVAQLPQMQNQNSGFPNANFGQPKSVKDRLGYRIHGNNNSNNNKSNFGQGSSQRLFPVDSNNSSFVIPNAPKPMAKPTFLENRINKTATTAQPMAHANSGSIGSDNQLLPNVFQPPILPPLTQNPRRMQQEIKLALPSFASGPKRFEPVFTYLFKRTCRFYMIDACQNPNECLLEHRLPDHDFFSKSLDKMFQASVIDLYDEYMRRNQKLFDYYFVVFCKYFGKNNLVDKLKQMVDDCTERRVPFHFTNIVEGLKLTGRTFERALGEVITSVQCRNVKTSKEIVKLILSPNVDNIRPFISILDSIARQDNLKFSSEWTNRLLIIHHEKQVTELEHTIWHLVSRAAELNQFAVLDQELANNFVQDYGRKSLSIKI